MQSCFRDAKLDFLDLFEKGKDQHEHNVPPSPHVNHWNPIAELQCHRSEYSILADFQEEI